MVTSLIGVSGAVFSDSACHFYCRARIDRHVWMIYSPLWNVRFPVVTVNHCIHFDLPSHGVVMLKVIVCSSSEVIIYESLF